MFSLCACERNAGFAYSTHLPNGARTVRRLETAANRLILRVSPIPLFVIARFMRATNFFSNEKKLGGPDKPGHDDRDHNHKGITP
jgi:hypothetical protein